MKYYSYTDLIDDTLDLLNLYRDYIEEGNFDSVFDEEIEGSCSSRLDYLFKGKCEQFAEHLTYITNSGYDKKLISYYWDSITRVITAVEELYEYRRQALCGLDDTLCDKNDDLLIAIKDPLSYQPDDQVSENNKRSTFLKIADEIANYIESENHPVSESEIKESIDDYFDGILPFAVNESVIINYDGEYISPNSLVIDQNTKRSISDKLNDLLGDCDWHLASSLFEGMRDDFSVFFSANFIYNWKRMYYLFMYLFSDSFQFRNFKMALNDKIDDNILFTYRNSSCINIHDCIYDARLRGTKYNIITLFEQLKDDFFICNNKEMRKQNQLGLSASEMVNIVWMIKNEIKARQITTIDKLECVYLFPQIPYGWNKWIIYSILKKYGTGIYYYTENNSDDWDLYISVEMVITDKLVAEFRSKEQEEASEEDEFQATMDGIISTLLEEEKHEF